MPGSAPPRGPPRNIGPGAEDHPNRGVSKLALLRNSNEYIVMLQRRVQRRDGALGRMREEVECLKGLVRGFEGGKEKLGERVWGEWDDDLDAIEKEVEEERERLGAARPTERLRAGIGASTTTTASVATLAQIQQQNDITEESGGVNRDDG